MPILFFVNNEADTDAFGNNNGTVAKRLDQGIRANITGAY